MISYLLYSAETGLSTSPVGCLWPECLHLILTYMYLASILNGSLQELWLYEDLFCDIPILSSISRPYPHLNLSFFIFNSVHVDPKA